MESITIKRTGEPPLTFRGKSVTEEVGGWQAGKEVNRWYDLTIYTTDNKGRYVAVISYQTQWQGEDGRQDATVGSAANVKAWLGQYDPNKHVAGFPGGEHYQDRQEKLLRGLRNQFDARLGDLLLAAIAHDAAFGETDQDVVDDSYAELDHEAVMEFVRTQLSEFSLTTKEASAVCDANNGAMLMPGQSWVGLAANVFDADRLGGLGEKWDVDCQSLGARIMDADRGTQFAIMYATAQFWRHCDLDTDEALKVAGFTIS